MLGPDCTATHTTGHTPAPGVLGRLADIVPPNSPWERRDSPRGAIQRQREYSKDARQPQQQLSTAALDFALSPLLSHYTPWATENPLPTLSCSSCGQGDGSGQYEVASHSLLGNFWEFCLHDKQTDISITTLHHPPPRPVIQPGTWMRHLEPWQPSVTTRKRTMGLHRRWPHTTGLSVGTSMATSRLLVCGEKETPVGSNCCICQNFCSLKPEVPPEALTSHSSDHPSIQPGVNKALIILASVRSRLSLIFRKDCRKEKGRCRDQGEGRGGNKSGGRGACSGGVLLRLWPSRVEAPFPQELMYLRLWTPGLNAPPSRYCLHINPPHPAVRSRWP